MWTFLCAYLIYRFDLFGICSNLGERDVRDSLFQRRIPCVTSASLKMRDFGAWPHNQPQTAVECTEAARAKSDRKYVDSSGKQWKQLKKCQTGVVMNEVKHNILCLNVTGISLLRFRYRSFLHKKNPGKPKFSGVTDNKISACWTPKAPNTPCWMSGNFFVFCLIFSVNQRFLDVFNYDFPARGLTTKNWFCILRVPCVQLPRASQGNKWEKKLGCCSWIHLNFSK